jgi:hypothetical protein
MDELAVPCLVLKNLVSLCMLCAVEVKENIKIMVIVIQ